MQSWQDEVEVILGARGPLTAILPSHKEPPPSVWPQSSQLYFLPTHAFKERVNTPCGALVKKPRLRRLSSSLLDDHLVSFLPLILKRDNGLLQSCLTGLLRLLVITVNPRAQLALHSLVARTGMKVHATS